MNGKLQNEIWEKFGGRLQKANPLCLAVNTVLAGNIWQVPFPERAGGSFRLSCALCCSPDFSRYNLRPPGYPESPTDHSAPPPKPRRKQT